MTEYPVIQEESFQVCEERQDKYYYKTPNILDDLGLDPYTFRLYGHLKRVAGEDGRCFQSVNTMASICHMGRDKIIDAKKELAKPRKELNGKPLIKIIKTEKGLKKADRIIIIDIMDDNIKKYSTKSATSTTVVDDIDYRGRRHRLKEEPLKNNKKEQQQDDDVSSQNLIYKCLQEADFSDDFKRRAQHLKKTDGTYYTEEEIKRATKITKNSNPNCQEAFFTDCLKNPKKYELKKSEDERIENNKMWTRQYLAKYDLQENNGFTLHVGPTYVEIASHNRSECVYYKDKNFNERVKDEIKLRMPGLWDELKR